MTFSLSQTGKRRTLQLENLFCSKREHEGYVDKFAGYYQSFGFKCIPGDMKFSITPDESDHGILCGGIGMITPINKMTIIRLCNMIIFFRLISMINHLLYIKITGASGIASCALCGSPKPLPLFTNLSRMKT